VDIGLLLIFLCAGSWFYAGAMLALADRRWNRARLIQYALCAGLCAWLVASRRTGPEYVQSVLLLVAVTFFVPRLIQWRIHELLLKGRTRSARAWERVLSLLDWRSPSAVFPAIERIYAAAASSGVPAIIGGAGGLARLTAAASRRAFIENQINAWIALRECGNAIELFETNFGPGRLAPDVGLLYAMVIPYSESGDVRNAARCLRRGQEMQETANPRDMRRFVAYVHVYAQSGRVYALERLLDRNPGAVALLPPAYPRLWRGVALLRHGEPEVARDVLASALARQRPGEEWLGRIAQRYLALPAGEAAPPPLDPEVAADLDAIEAREEPAAAPGFAQQTAAWRPFVSWGLIAACAVVYLLTESFGSSEDTFTLVRFGANVPSMVRLGDWWRLVSNIFLHVGLLHLAFNLYALYLFGPFVERLAGRWEIFVVFMVSGVCGSAASAWLGHAQMSAGASGAIFGLLGAATVIGLTFHGIPNHVRKVYLLNFLFIVAINLAYGFFEPHIDNLAHIGGMVSGALVGLCLSPAGADNRRRLLFRLAGLLMAFFVAVTLWTAANNVAEGGYPMGAQMRTYSGEQGGWSIKVPRFWQMGGRTATKVEFDDPLGAALTIELLPPGTVKLKAARGETLSAPEPVQIGRYAYDRYSLTTTQGDEPVTRFCYLTKNQPDSNYLLVFECERSHATDYAGLIERILAGFEIRGAGPAKPRLPETAA
jgi:membrane associated rhomboid family serine protease